MILLELLVVALGFALFMFILTQVFLPMIFDTPLYPTFRKSTPMKEEVSKAEKELEERTELILLELKLRKLNSRKAELEKK